MDAKVSDAGNTEAMKDAASSGSSDPLLDCLGFVARRFGISFSPAGALSGLPLKNGRLDEENFPRAATRFGLSARTLARNVYDIPAMVLPAVVLLKNGDACVLTNLDKKRHRAKIFYPHETVGERAIDLSKLAEAAIGAEDEGGLGHGILLSCHGPNIAPRIRMEIPTLRMISIHI